MPKKNPWDVLSVAPAGSSDWDVVSTDVDPNAPPPVNASVPVPVALQGAPDAPPAKFGSSVGDVLSTLGQRAKNFVASPYHAFADAPRNPEEQLWKGTNPQSGMAANALGQFGLGTARMFVEPTIVNARNAKAQFQAGNNEAGFQSAMDAVPVVGPWAKQIETDTQQKGAVAGLSGLAFDAFAPKVAGKVASGSLRGLGSAMRVGTSTPDGLRLAATRALVPGESGAVLQRAIRPAIGYGPQAAGLLQDTLGDVVAQNPKIQNLGDYAQATQDAAGQRNQYHQNLISPYRQPSGPGPFRPSAVPGGAIADAQVNSIPATNLVDDPTTPTRQGIFDRTADRAQNWRQNFSVPELDDIREDTNAKLDDFYNKAGGDQHAALSNPETARLFATNNAVRGLEYGQLSQDTGIPVSDIESNQRAYGNLSQVGKMVGNRDAVFSRQSPVSLAESMALSGGSVRHGLRGFLAERALKSLTDSNALVRSALDRYANPGGSTFPPRSNLFAVATNKTGAALQTAAPYIHRGLNSAVARTLFVPKKQNSVAPGVR